MEIVHPYFKVIFLTILKPMPLPQSSSWPRD